MWQLNAMWVTRLDPETEKGISGKTGETFINQ